MSTVGTLVTAEEFGRLESDQLCELVRGRLVEINLPYPRHGQVCIQIAKLTAHHPIGIQDVMLQALTALRTAMPTSANSSVLRNILCQEKP